MKTRVHLKAAQNAAASEVMVPESLEDRFQVLESEDRIEVLLQEIKTRQAIQ